ncbi:tyrosine-type recombinase/integrase [Streptomyces parvus]|uniref:tyrosine-type recombinase/integrase n=1 Tax=Streptomyces parvus TaxID=66428 RepID=UPI0035DB1A6D
MRLSGLSLEEFLATTKKRLWRGIGVRNCRVPDCARPWKTSLQPLCITHLHQQQKQFRLPLEEFLRLPGLRPLPSFGPCQVASCPRDREGTSKFYCQAHNQRRAYELRRGSTLDEETWRLTTSAIAQSGVISLRGLADRVVGEVLFGMQECNTDGLRQKDFMIRPLCDLARTRQAASLKDLDQREMSRNTRRWATGFLRHSARVLSSPETERFKDIWNGAVFGLTGHLYFDKITQPWLRRATQDWAVDDVPRRRGNPRSVVQQQINSIARLSESLRINRPDQGSEPHRLGRQDVVAFMHRLMFLHSREEITAKARCSIVRSVRRLLSRMRSLGLAQSGHPLHGLPETFSIREEDVPDDPEDSEAGRDLPPEVMRQLCAHLDALGDLGAPEGRVAVEVLIDTGRRPGEVCNLPLDCLERDADGKPVLVYDNRKALRNGRRLPIAEATAGVIIQQQERTRARFPDTPVKDLKLLPSIVANPAGTKATTSNWVASRHRAWVDSLPEILVPTVVEVDGQRITRMLPFDKSKIFPYAYRHTYAQRHADAGVQPDVLKVLMDHRQLDTTQRYYRVGEERRREAVDRVVAMQFDRHGNRVWRAAQALLDSEHARRAVGQVSVPYGVCTEPSNVAAGGQDCPVRFRCVGCDHFRTDVSYLPDLESYLADLLRSRERLAAFVNADAWAKAEALPSDEEITRVRRLIQRVRGDLDDLSEEDRTQIQEAVTIVRRTRRVVPLGMPSVRQPLPNLRPERPV